MFVQVIASVVSGTIFSLTLNKLHTLNWRLIGDVGMILFLEILSYTSV